MAKLTISKTIEIPVRVMISYREGADSEWIEALEEEARKNFPCRTLATGHHRDHGPYKLETVE